MKNSQNRIRYDGIAMCYKDKGAHFGIFWNEGVLRSQRGIRNISLTEWLIECGKEDLIIKRNNLSHQQPPRELQKDESYIPMNPRRPGICGLFTTYGRYASLLSTDTITLDIGEEHSLTFFEQEDMPQGVIQKFEYNTGLSGISEITWVDESSLYLRFTLKTGKVAAVINPALTGAPVDENRFQCIETSDDQIIITQNPATRITFDGLTDFQTVHKTDTPPLADVRISWGIQSDMTPAKGHLWIEGAESPFNSIRSITGGLSYQIMGSPVHLSPHQTHTIQVVLALEQNNEKHIATILDNASQLTFPPDKNIIKEQEEHWATTLESLPKLPEDSAHRLRLYEQAVVSLNRTIYAGTGPFLNGRNASYCTTGNCLCVAHYWDSCFTAVALSEVLPQYASDAIDVMLENANRYGAPPECVGRHSVTAAGQAPIEAWAAWAVYEKSRDKAFLKRVYDASSNYNAYWFRFRDLDQDGLCEWRNGGQIGDDSPRWDIEGVVRCNEDMWEFSSPDLNAFLFSQMEHLEKMAQELGLSEESSVWAVRRKELAARVIEKMYVKNENRFADITLLTDKALPTLCPNHFIPLWAGINPGEELAKKMIQTILLSEKYFFANPPFPSISFDHPQYDPYGYWRGRIWPHMTYWMIETLWMYGFEKEADLAAERMLDLFEKYPYFQENYSGDGRPAGIPEYNWTAATAILLLLRKYRHKNLSTIN